MLFAILGCRVVESDNTLHFKNCCRHSTFQKKAIVRSSKFSQKLINVSKVRSMQLKPLPPTRRPRKPFQPFPCTIGWVNFKKKAKHPEVRKSCARVFLENCSSYIWKKHSQNFWNIFLTFSFTNWGCFVFVSNLTHPSVQ